MSDSNYIHLGIFLLVFCNRQSHRVDHSKFGTKSTRRAARDVPPGERGPRGRSGANAEDVSVGKLMPGKHPGRNEACFLAQVVVIWFSVN